MKNTAGLAASITFAVGVAGVIAQGVGQLIWYLFFFGLSLLAAWSHSRERKTAHAVLAWFSAYLTLAHFAILQWVGRITHLQGRLAILLAVMAGVPAAFVAAYSLFALRRKWNR